MKKIDLTKWQDEYVQLLSINLNPDSEFASNIKETARRLINESIGIYHNVTEDLTKVGVVHALVAKGHADPRFQDRLIEALSNETDDEKRTKLREMIDRGARLFRENAKKYDTMLMELINTIESSNADLCRNMRGDLSKIGFTKQLTDVIEKCQKNISSFKEYLMECFVQPINGIKDEIVGLDKTIEERLDPRNIMKNFKSFLPTEKEVADFIQNGSKSTTASEIEAIKLLYSTALKAFTVIGDVLVLCKDIDKRTNLYNKLEALTQGYEHAVKQRQRLTDEYDEAYGLTVLNKKMEFFSNAATDIISYLLQIRKQLDNFLETGDMKGYYECISAFMSAIETSQR